MMAYLPEALLDSLENAPGFNRKQFEAAHETDRVHAIRLHPTKTAGQDAGQMLPLAGPVPWCPGGYYLGRRPSFILDPLWHAGAYYVQDPSSMSLAFAMTHLLAEQAPVQALDLCAAPGGKSTLMASFLPAGSALVSNEVIGSRVPVLAENIVRWGMPDVLVTRRDAKDFGRLGPTFDLIVVDAPCSGSGLFRKDPEAVGEWSSEGVAHCSRRQRRILGDVMDALRPGGLLCYATCSYSVAEDEEISRFLQEDFALEPLTLPFSPSWGIVESKTASGEVAGYRFYPDRLAGEGFFLACFRKPGASPDMRAERAPRRKQSAADGAGALAPWLAEPDRWSFREKDGEVYVMGGGAGALLDAVGSRLHPVFAGCHAGKVVRGELVPDHALALGTLLSPAVPRLTLSRDEALAYLRKAPLDLPRAPRGWTIASFEGQGLGWIKGLGHRINNYYPTSWRIRRPG